MSLLAIFSFPTPNESQVNVTSNTQRFSLLQSITGGISAYISIVFMRSVHYQKLWAWIIPHPTFALNFGLGSGAINLVILIYTIYKARKINTGKDPGQESPQDIEARDKKYEKLNQDTRHFTDYLGISSLIGILIIFYASRFIKTDHHFHTLTEKLIVPLFYAAAASLMSLYFQIKNDEQQKNWEKSPKESKNIPNTEGDSTLKTEQKRLMEKEVLQAEIVLLRAERARAYALLARLGIEQTEIKEKTKGETV